MASVRTLAYSMAAGGANPAPTPVLVMSSNPTEIAWSATASQPWIGLSAASGQTPAEVTVSVAGTGLAAGTYAGQVTFQAQGGPAWTVPVTLTVADPAPPQVKIRLPIIQR